MPETTSDLSAKSAQRKPHPQKPLNSTENWRNALLFAGVLAALFIGLSIAGVLVALVNDSFYRVTSSGGSLNMSDASAYLYSFSREVFSFYLPLAAGVFVALRFITPITTAMSIATVLLRGLIATLIGVVAAQVVGAIISWFGGLSLAGPIFGGSFPEVVGVEGFAFDFLYRISTVIPSALQSAPTVVLVLILGWLWMRRVPLKPVVPNTAPATASTKPVA